MVRRVAVFVLICFLFVPFVVAAPPSFVSQTEGTLIVQAPKFSIQQQYREFDIHSHVFNSTGYIQNGTQVNCTLHVYNSTNNHVLKTDMVSDGYDYESPVLLNGTGEHSFTVFCVNNKGEGGFSNVGFLVTRTGLDDTNEDLSINAALLLGVFLISLFFAVSAHQFKDDEEHTILSYALFLFGALFAVFGLVLGLLYTGEFYGAHSIDAPVSYLAWGFGGILTLIISYWIIYLITIALAWKNFRKGGGGQ